jgi:hypothetical protein
MFTLTPLSTRNRHEGLRSPELLMVGEGEGVMVAEIATGCEFDTSDVSGVSFSGEGWRG